MRALLLIGLFGIVGCSEDPPVADKDAARSLLSSCLDAWKSGASLESQRTESPPVFIVEDAWRAGTPLKDYQILDSPTVVGQTSRFVVDLTFGRSKEQVQYAVTTEPARTISRLDF